MEKIQDFGQKIGGARKDLYAIDNINDLTDIELKGVTRDKIWKKPNINKELELLSREIVYFKETIRKAIPAKPVQKYSKWTDDNEESIKAYILTVNKFKALAEKNELDFSGLKKLVEECFEYNGYRATPIGIAGRSVACNKLCRLRNYNLKDLKADMDKEGFGLTTEEKLRQRYNKEFYTAFFKKFTDDEYERPDSGVVVIPHDKTSGKRATVLRTSFGAKYIYPKSLGYEASEWEENTYFVMDCAMSPLALNFKTKEEAMKVRDELVEKHVLLGLENCKLAKSTKRSSRKTKFSIPKFAGIKQTDPVDRDITGQDYLDVFGFKGGEFGKWLNEKDRQLSLNYGFTAFKNLASVLGIEDLDISLGKDMNIAFGARGRSAARAHFEPDRNVINLTKLNGAGSLAHEWGHAFDYFLGKYYGYVGLLSEDYSYTCSMRPRHTSIPDAINDAFISLCWQNGKETRYYSDSRKFDKNHSKDGGYWASRCEMFARAFACYVEEKMKEMGMIDTYLTDHAFCYVEEIDGEKVYAIPTGEEKDVIFKAFEKMFQELIHLGILTEKDLQNKNIA